ncbi:MAG TPA: DUF3052 domain-containing protein [Acidimicrobiales bacterium]|jgi:hypothetical protein|nr:DUF3052 domain-containing protein [Acidimicrobiales bacterium]
MAGYSGTPLARKLGIREGDALALLSAPDGFAIDDLPLGVEVRRRARGVTEVIVSFHTRQAELARRFPTLMRALAVDGGLWVAWPKRTSGVETDITEDVVREVALPTGMVDNKVCAIDDTWSGLRLVLRKELRPGRTTAAG